MDTSTAPNLRAGYEGQIRQPFKVLSTGYLVPMGMDEDPYWKRTTRDLEPIGKNRGFPCRDPRPFVKVDPDFCGETVYATIPTSVLQEGLTVWWHNMALTHTIDHPLRG